MSTDFKYLFTPLQINSVQVRNRIVQTAHAKTYEDCVDNGAMTGEINAYYHVERAKGGEGVQSDDRLYRDLKGKVKSLYRVGDCIAPRPMEHAFWEGEEIGRAL